MNSSTNLLLTIKNHHTIVDFILKKGNTQNNFNRYGNNPYYDFHEFETYLLPPPSENIVDCKNLGILYSSDQIIIALQFKGIYKKYAWLHISIDKKNQKLIIENRGNNKYKKDVKKDLAKYFTIMLEEIKSKGY